MRQSDSCLTSASSLALTASISALILSATSRSARVLGYGMGAIREAGREADDESTFLPLSDPDPNPDIGGRQRVAPPKHTSTPSAEKDAVNWRT